METVDDGYILRPHGPRLWRVTNGDAKPVISETDFCSRFGRAPWGYVGSGPRELGSFIAQEHLGRPPLPRFATGVFERWLRTAPPEGVEISRTELEALERASRQNATGVDGQ